MRNRICVGVRPAHLAGRRAAASPAQRHPVHSGRIARPEGHARDRAGDGGAARRRRRLQEPAFPVPDLHHRQRGRLRDRPLRRRHRRLQQHDLHRLSGAGARCVADGDAVPRERRGARRRRSSLRRQLPRRGDHPEDRPRAGLQHRGGRQARPDPDLRPHRADRPRDDHHRRRDGRDRQERPSGRHPAVGRGQGGAAGRRAAARGAVARRQRRGRRLRQAGHHGRQRRPAGVFHRCGQQGRAADVQGAQQALPRRGVVARPGRLAAQSGRQPQFAQPRHQRPDLARRDQECRRQSPPDRRRP